MTEAKIFQSGNSQALRLPKEYRFDGESVGINRIGNLIVLIPKNDPWRSFIEGVHDSKDFPEISNKKLRLRKVAFE